MPDQAFSRAEYKHESFILDKQGKVRPLLANGIIMLRDCPEWEGVLGFNQFSLQAVALKPPPWRKEPDTPDQRTAQRIKKFRRIILQKAAASHYVRVRSSAAQTEGLG